jgi:hypothetical protein
MLAEDVALWATGLADASIRAAKIRAGERCDVRGQARTVVTIWLMGHVVPPEEPHMLQIDANFGRQSSAMWGPAETSYAKQLLASPRARERMHANWETLLKPTTTIDQALPLLGLERTSNAPMGATPCL